MTRADGDDSRLRSLSRVLAKALAATLVVLLVVEVALRIGGAFFLEQHRSDDLAGGDEVFTIVALGESSTALWGEDAYPNQLEGLLRERLPGQPLKVLNLGMPGVDSDHIIEHLEETLDAHEPDLVTVMMGINDGERAFDALSPHQEPSRLQRALQGLKLYRFWAFTRGNVELVRWREERLQAAAERVTDLRAEQAHTPTLETAIQLALALRQQGLYVEELEVLRHAIEEWPGPRSYGLLARALWDRGSIDEEVALLETALERFQPSHLVYRLLSTAYRRQGRGEDALAILEARAEAFPTSPASLTDIADVHLGRGDLRQALAWYRTSTELRRLDYPNDDYAFVHIAECEERLGDPEAAEAALRRALEVRRSGEALTALAMFLDRQDRPDEAQEAFEEAITGGAETWPFYKNMPGRDYALHLRPEGVGEAILELARFHQRRGDPERARATLARGEANPRTLHNYGVLSDVVLERVGRLVAIQYPMRDLESLEALILPREGLVLVETREPFEEGVLREGYGTWFIDDYGGDFGHCTREGNRLIAEEVAEGIVEAFF